MRFFRKTLLGVLLLFTAFGILSIVPVRHVRSGREPTATMNGDVNCDGSFDVSDPIFMLRHLFLGDRAPCAIAQEPGVCCPEILDRLDRLETATDENEPTWPPKPENTVSLSGEGLEGEEGHVAFTVPKDQAFVLTHLDFGFIDANAEIWELFEDGRRTRKWHRTSQFSSTPGILFSGASRVQLVLDSDFRPEVPYSLTGYLVDSR